METGQIVLSRLVPKTGQTTEHRAGDDGTYQAGWWKGLTHTANKTRFILKTIGVDKVVIDNATGLMWAADGNAAGGYNGIQHNWEDCIDYANALDFAGFTDWRVPSIFELASIIIYDRFSPAILEPPFSNTASTYTWTSTAYPDDVLNKWFVYFPTGRAAGDGKQNLFNLRCVRGGL